MNDNEMKLEFLSKSCNEAFARITVAAFVSQLDPTIEELSDIKTAVSEAVTNCIIHGYEDCEGVIKIKARIIRNNVEIEISDTGRFSGLFPEFSFECEQPLVVGITMRDIDRVLSTLMDEQNVTLFAIISLVLRTGLTTEEICGLKIQQLVTNGQTDQCGIMILGIRNRFIKVPSDLFSLLLLLSEQTDNETGNLFLTRLKQCPFTQRNLLLEIKKACLRAGVRPFTLQQLRNFSILLMLRSHAPEEVVSDYVSTDSRWMTRYKEAAPSLNAAPCDYVALSLRYNS